MYEHIPTFYSQAKPEIMVYKPRLPYEVLIKRSIARHQYLFPYYWDSYLSNTAQNKVTKWAFCNIRDLIRMWIWNDFSFLRDNFRRKIPYFIFRHIWGTESRRLNADIGISSPNPFILDLSCKPQSLTWTDTGQIRESPLDTPRVHSWHSYSYRTIQNKNVSAFENRLADQLVTDA